MTSSRSTSTSEPLPAQRTRIRTRAVDADDREQRRNAILAAAEELFAASATHDISIAEVAAQAGLAKGTIYLYFDSKEALLLTLHERRVEAFFDELMTALESAPVFGFEQMALIVRRHMTEEPLYMALCAVVMGFMNQPQAPDSLQQLSNRIANWMIQAGALLEARLGRLPAGQGVRLLVHGYAQIVGLWHLLAAPCATPSPASVAAEHSLGPLNYANEAEYALAQLWASALESHESPPLPKKVISHARKL